MLITTAVDYLIPDIPRKLREHVRREAYLTNEIILRTELQIARGSRGGLSEEQLREIRQRVRGPMLHMLSMSDDSGAKDAWDGRAGESERSRKDSEQEPQDPGEEESRV